MAARTSLTVDILVNAAQAASQLNETASGFSKAFGDLKKNLAEAFAGAAIIAFVKSAVSAASDLEQAVGATDLVFKDSASTIHDWAADTSDDFRIPARDAEAFAVKVGSSLLKAGQSTKEASEEVKTLAMVAADLGAAFGDTPGALEAVSAAISKGEWERLESWGISIKQSDVNAEIERIADSMGGLTQENKRSIETQARINILMQEAALYSGAAASEADTFAASQDRLNEKWQEFLTAVGGPLLDALGGFLDIASSLLGVVAPLAAGIATLAASVLDLPGPVLATAAAFAGWMIIQQLGGAMAIFTTVMVNARVAIMLASVAVRGFFAAIGPVGWIILAIGAIATAFSLLGDSSDDLEEVEASWQKLTDAVKSGGDEAFRKELWDTGEIGGFNEALRNAGVSVKTYMDAAAGVPGAQEDLQAQVDAATEAIFEQGGAFASIGPAAKAAGISQREFLEAISTGGQGLADVRAKMQAYADEQGRLSGNVQTGIDIMNEFDAAVASGTSTADALLNVTTMSAEANKRYAEGLGEAATKARELGTAEGDTMAIIMEAEARTKQYADTLKAAKIMGERTAGAGFLAQAETDAKEAARALDIFSAAMDQATAKVEITDNALLGWSDSLDGLKGDIEAYIAEVGGAGDALAGWDINTLRATESGRAAAKSALESAQSYQEVVAAAFSAKSAQGDLAGATADAAAAATAARGEFLSWAQSAGLTETQAAALANELGILDATQIDPKLFEIIAQDAEAQAKIAQLVAAGIDPKSFTITAVTDPATGAVKQMISYIDSTGATVTIDADPKPAEAAAAGAAANAEAQNPLMPVGADTSSAAGSVASATNAIVSTPAPIQVTADTTQAWSAVQLFASATAAIPAIVQVTANPAQAQATLAAITGRLYTLSIAFLPEPQLTLGTIAAIIGRVYTLTIAFLPRAEMVVGALMDIVGRQYMLTIVFMANAGPAVSALSSIVGGSYRATVTIYADTGPFMSAWNSLPTSKTITVTVNQVQGTVVAAAAPKTVAAPALTVPAPSARAALFAAPPAVGPQAVTAAPAGSTINITIQGAVDPEGTARTVRNVLRRSEFRRGAITVGV